MIFCISETLSLILVPILIVLLSFVLIIIVGRKKTDTLAQLAFEMQKLIENCKSENPDLKEIKKLDIAAAKCSLLCDRASFEQKQDLGPVPEQVGEARNILHSLYTAKVEKQDSAEYIELAKSNLERGYRFLINTLGITAAPAYASLDFFRRNLKSENAKKYLDSLPVDKHSKKAPDEQNEHGKSDE